MRKHNGMRPQDIVVMLKIITIKTSQWQLASLSHSLKLSLSEISESLNRSRIAGLIDHQKENVNRQSLLEFLEHGVKYVFPQQPGSMVRGIPTAHSYPSIKKIFISEIDYVWPHSKGTIMGLAIEPFYYRQADAVLNDELLHRLLALVDMIRVGRVREVKYAVGELNRIINEPS